MTTVRWTHQTEIEVLTTPEDYEPIQVRIHVQGDPGRPKAFNISQMQWGARARLPGHALVRVSRPGHGQVARANVFRPGDG